MHESPQDAFVAAIVKSIATQSRTEVDTLALALTRRCWPGGPADRVERAALPWVRRWGPTRLTPIPPVCSCAEGHCPVCN